MTPPEQAALRAGWQRARHPEDIDRCRRLSAALDDAGRGGQLLLSYTSGLTDSAAIETAEAKARAAQEAIAG